MADLRAGGRPVWMRPPGAKAMCERMHGAFRSHDATRETVTAFRVHPFPEHSDGKRRRSVREAECAYVEARIADFFAWASAHGDDSGGGSGGGSGGLSEIWATRSHMRWREQTSSERRVPW